MCMCLCGCGCVWLWLCVLLLLQTSEPRATLQLVHGLHLHQYMQSLPWSSTWCDPEEARRFDLTPAPELVGLRVLYFEGFPADGPEEWEIIDPALYT